MHPPGANLAVHTEVVNILGVGKHATQWASLAAGKGCQIGS